MWYTVPALAMYFYKKVEHSTGISFLFVSAKNGVLMQASAISWFRKLIDPSVLLTFLRHEGECGVGTGSGENLNSQLGHSLKGCVLACLHSRTIHFHQSHIVYHTNIEREDTPAQCPIFVKWKRFVCVQIKYIFWFSPPFFRMCVAAEWQKQMFNWHPPVYAFLPLLRLSSCVPDFN